MSNYSFPRIFVALFDYEPATMSPNPDSSDEELPFREGQLIKIVGEKDSDGFYWGEAGNRTGYVPCNMVNNKIVVLYPKLNGLLSKIWFSPSQVSEVQVDDDQVAEELFREQQSKGPAPPPATGSNGVAVKSHHSTAGETDDDGNFLSER